MSKNVGGIFLELWVIFTLIYGILKGAREPIKKSILQGVGVLPALFAYTFIGFLMSVPLARGIFSFPPRLFFFIAMKAAVLVFAWLLSFKGIRKIPVSVYGICDMSRVIFSTLLGVVFLSESLTLKGIISLVLVAVGLYFANQRKAAANEGYQLKYVWYILLSCFLNAISGILDKYIMATGQITSSALQFWFMLFLSMFYLLYMLIRREKPELKKSFSNPLVYVLSFLLIFGDRLIFIANADAGSQVTIMTILKQSSAVVTILLGKFIYKEKNIAKKLVCACVIILGIVLSVS